MKIKIHSVRVGQVFGSWRVQQTEAFLRPDGYYCMCECTCGKIALVQVRALVAGKTKSCGCRRIERSESCMRRLWEIWDGLPRPRRGWMDWNDFTKWALRNGYNKKAKLRLHDVEFGYNATNCYWVNARTRNNRLPDYEPGWVVAKP